MTKLKHRILGKMTEVAKKVMFGKLLVNSGIFPERPETIDYYILRRIFSQFTFSTNFPELVLNISVRQ